MKFPTSFINLVNELRCRYVLEHKIEDLRRQIQPKDEMILDLRSQIEEMEEELNSVSKTQSDLELNVSFDNCRNQEKKCQSSFLS